MLFQVIEHVLSLTFYFLHSYYHLLTSILHHQNPLWRDERDYDPWINTINNINVPISFGRQCIISKKKKLLLTFFVSKIISNMLSSDSASFLLAASFAALLRPWPCNIFIILSIELYIEWFIYNCSRIESRMKINRQIYAYDWYNKTICLYHK